MRKRKRQVPKETQRPLLQPREPHDGRLTAMMVEEKKQPQDGVTRMGAGDGDGYRVQRIGEGACGKMSTKTEQLKSKAKKISLTGRKCGL